MNRVEMIQFIRANEPFYEKVNFTFFSDKTLELLKRDIEYSKQLDALQSGRGNDELLSPAAGKDTNMRSVSVSSRKTC